MNWEYFDKFEEVSKKYMPFDGEGETQASQIVTAINKLIYKWYNDGDVYDNTYRMKGWWNDLSSYANWLANNVDGAKRILLYIKDARTDDDYEDILRILADEFLTFDFLKDYENKDKCGSIYYCDGVFEFVEYEDEDDEW